MYSIMSNLKTAIHVFLEEIGKHEVFPNTIPGIREAEDYIKRHLEKQSIDEGNIIVVIGTYRPVTCTVENIWNVKLED